MRTPDGTARPCPPQFQVRAGDLFTRHGVRCQHRVARRQHLTPHPLVIHRLLASALVAISLGSGAPTGGERATLSIDRFQQWLASGEGTTEPATGSILVREGHRCTAKIKFLDPEWPRDGRVDDPARTGRAELPVPRGAGRPRGFVFVGKTPNELEFRGLRVDGYRPSCVY